MRYRGALAPKNQDDIKNERNIKNEETEMIKTASEWKIASKLDKVSKNEANLKKQCKYCLHSIRFCKTLTTASCDHFHQPYPN